MPHSTPPSHEPLAFDASDGARLRGTRFHPAGEPLAHVLLHGAMATPSGYYRRFASYLADAGFDVVTYDYRGVGLSREGSLRDFRADAMDWLEKDAAAAVAQIPNDGLPFLVMGHSFGGQVGLALPIDRQPDAALFVASQRGYVGEMSSPRLAEFQARYLVPAMSRAFGYLPGFAGLGVDLPGGVARQWMRWALEPAYFLSEHPELGERMARFEGPVGMISFTDDHFAPLSNVEWLIERFENARVHHRHIRPIDIGRAKVDHHGAFREEVRAPVWEAMRSFLVAAASGRPIDLSGLPDARERRSLLAERELLEDLWYGEAA